jgi:two-component system, sensor histidine kinase PdtaS
VPTLTELARRHTALGEEELAWLHALVADWQLVADLSFADLILWVPDRSGGGYVALAQIRPTTGPTVFQDDLVGRRMRRGERPLVDSALDEGRVCREGDPEWRGDVPVREETIPVRHADRVIAVVARQTNLASARTPSRLELAYLQSAADLAQMLAEGSFPFLGPHAEPSPRVGDGLVRLGADGIVAYASPNALSAYRRLGLAADVVGSHLGALTTALAPALQPVDESVEVALSGGAPRRVEVEANGIVISLRVIPLVRGGEHIGALVLVRDVTELRGRERELITKDATIREIHHRVKNNLQTVAALLRLQARRLDEPDGRAALEEAVRRVGSIALVHETLSHAPDETVEFDDILDRIMAMVGEVALVGEVPGDGVYHLERRGTSGPLPAEVATPLSLALTEIVQNAIEHGFHRRPGTVTLTLDRSAHRLRVSVEDDGAGLPEEFDANASGQLGLQIVRTLVLGELSGRLSLGPRAEGGTRVVVDVPVEPAT